MFMLVLFLNPSTECILIYVSALQRTCYAVMRCDNSSSNSLGVMVTNATTSDGCCSQPNVISVLHPDGVTCDLCKITC